MLYEDLIKSLKRIARLDCEADGMFSPEEHTAWEAAETIEKLEKQRDELLRALEYSIKQVPELASVPGISEAIASVKGGA